MRARRAKPPRRCWHWRPRAAPASTPCAQTCEPDCDFSATGKLVLYGTQPRPRAGAAGRSRCSAAWAARERVVTPHECVGDRAGARPATGAASPARSTRPSECAADCLKVCVALAAGAGGTRRALRARHRVEGLRAARRPQSRPCAPARARSRPMPSCWRWARRRTGSARRLGRRPAGVSAQGLQHHAGRRRTQPAPAPRGQRDRQRAQGGVRAHRRSACGWPAWPSWWATTRSIPAGRIETLAAATRALFPAAAGAAPSCTPGPACAPPRRPACPIVGRLRGRARQPAVQHRPRRARLHAGLRLGAARLCGAGPRTILLTPNR